MKTPLRPRVKLVITIVLTALRPTTPQPARLVRLALTGLSLKAVVYVTLDTLTTGMNSPAETAPLLTRTALRALMTSTPPRPPQTTGPSSPLPHGPPPSNPTINALHAKPTISSTRHSCASPVLLTTVLLVAALPIAKPATQPQTLPNTQTTFATSAMFPTA